MLINFLPQRIIVSRVARASGDELGKDGVIFTNLKALKFSYFSECRHLGLKQREETPKFLETERRRDSERPIHSQGEGQTGLTWTG